VELELLLGPGVVVLPAEQAVQVPGLVESETQPAGQLVQVLDGIVSEEEVIYWPAEQGSQSPSAVPAPETTDLPKGHQE
jgi:hypothetical protein